LRLQFRVSTLLLVMLLVALLLRRVVKNPLSIGFVVLTGVS
jgi:hypothetical protein